MANVAISNIGHTVPNPPDHLSLSLLSCLHQLDSILRLRLPPLLPAVFDVLSLREQLVPNMTIHE